MDLFHKFAEQLAESLDANDLRNLLAEMASALDLSSFAYLLPSIRSGGRPKLISTYPDPWISHYLRRRYAQIDPVVLQARRRQETFIWFTDARDLEVSAPQRRLMDEATQYGIRCGFTIPIHDYRGRFAALTFASDEKRPLFLRAIDRYETALEFMAAFFHVQAHRRLAQPGLVDGVALSPREFECLKWAARGKTGWEIGRILGISKRTAEFHRDNARKKLGIPTIAEASVRLALSRPSDFD